MFCSAASAPKARRVSSSSRANLRPLAMTANSISI
jgi:hypothetical protein